MARSINGRDQSGDDPASSFAAPANSQFDASSFNFPIDTQLAAMNPNYGMSTYPRDLDDPTASLAHSGAAQLSSLATPSNGADASMAPPQTPNQASFMSTRKSVDGLSDAMQIPLTGDKRKRSKTSRACDECRRKKVCSLSLSHVAAETDSTRFDAMRRLKLMAHPKPVQTVRKLE